MAVHGRPASGPTRPWRPASRSTAGPNCTYAPGWTPCLPGGAGPKEAAVSASTTGSGCHIVVAGAGYAGLHVALRLTPKLRNNPVVELTLIDRHSYHQALTELPRVVGGT